MEKNTQEVQLTVGKPVIPDDHITFIDKAYGERHFLRNESGYEEVTNPLVNPVRVHADRKYTMSDSAAFVAAINKSGGVPADGIIFYQGNYGQNNTVVTMFFDQNTRQEFIKLPLKNSLELRQFLGKGDEKTFDQKAFLKLIDTFPECLSVDSLPLFRAMVEKLQLSTTIDFESNADKDNLTFIYKEKTGGDQTGRIPKTLELYLPFYEGSDNRIAINVDLEVTTPREEGKKPELKLVNVKHERTEREALKREIASLQESLEGWTFVNGAYGQ